MTMRLYAERNSLARRARVSSDAEHSKIQC